VGTAVTTESREGLGMNSERVNRCFGDSFFGSGSAMKPDKGSANRVGYLSGRNGFMPKFEAEGEKRKDPSQGARRGLKRL